MALRGSSPVNLSALQRDYSALPKIAAIKAQANQGIFNTIKQGIDNRKQKIKDADEKAANIKVIESIKNSPLGQRVFGETSLSAEDIYSSFGKGGQQNFVELLSTMQKANIAQTEEQRRLAILKIAEQKNIDATIDKSIEQELLSRMLLGMTLGIPGDGPSLLKLTTGTPEDFQALASCSSRRKVIIPSPVQV